ncbi:class I SAM-dependent methyltransferase [Halobacillus salinarum]|uniref:Class I SAM-dependent methyltransferase n=1 Tax=Halobacillus salinarum TaxID=2932257 RepID=A0ABY4EL95_9BACI|nr:class I SAM-dependent methyltransferase [Halobacillus salinarum]UOQ44414.1 class I SAM-dependent methyltransferase [Halobacillus salinarum]
MNITQHNSRIWDKKVDDGVKYTNPVSKEKVENAKNGEWSIHVTTDRPVPRDWFPVNLKNVKILCLASGGGQQGPVLAAAGGDVTVVDLSKKQLEQDEMVAERDGLRLNTVQGEMTNLDFLEDESFDMIIHPVANVFIEDVIPLWKEGARVLKKGGTLIAGFTNPVLYLFDDKKEEEGVLDVKYSLPFSATQHLTDAELEECKAKGLALEFGHTLEDQIQGQINAGFAITGFYEDNFGGTRTVDQYFNSFIATKAVKLQP